MDIPPAPNTAYLLLGANLGDRARTLADARALLSRHGTLTAVSGLYETAPWGGVAVEGQPQYLNQALALHTLLDPFALLLVTQATETALGRQLATERWSPRPLDVDILLFGGIEMEFGDYLMLPHPRLNDRRFALAPLAEIAPDVVVPGYHQTVTALLAACPDPLAVERVG